METSGSCNVGCFVAAVMIKSFCSDLMTDQLLVAITHRGSLTEKLPYDRP
jgi:hypothetical protein